MNTSIRVAAMLMGIAVVSAACERSEPGPDGNAGVPGAGAEAVELATAHFLVEGMTCGGGAAATRMAVRRVDGVSSVDADYDDDTKEGRATVEYDPERASPEAIAEAIRRAGFTPTLRSGDTGA